MFTKILYIAVVVWLAVSFSKDKNKTKLALKKAWKSFENILPLVLAFIMEKTTTQEDVAKMHELAETQAGEK